VDIQNNWRPIETAQRFSMAHPNSQITPAHPGSYFMTGPLHKL
jgi:hypothetical protein